VSSHLYAPAITRSRNMTEKKKSWLIWGVMVVLIAVAGFLGIAFPIPVPPIPSASSQGFIYPPGAIYIEAGGKNQVFSSGTLQTFKSGSTLTADAGSTVSLLGTNVFAVPSFSGDTTINGNAAVTGTLIVTGSVTAGNGTAAAPAYAFTSDPNTGLYSVGANDIGVTTNGILAMDVSASAVTMALPLTSNGDVTFGVANTTASIAPAIQVTGTAGNAVTLTGGQAGVAATGAAGKNGGAVTITGGLGTDKEGAGTPSGDGGDVVLVGGAKGGTTSNVTGIVRVGAPSVQTVKTTNLLAVGGALEVDGAAQLDGGLGVVGVAKIGDGTVSLPGYSFTSDPDSGAYVIAPNNLGVAVNATKILDVGTTGLGIVGVVKSGDGTVSLPGYSFTSDPNTGLYSIGADNIGIATNGVKALDVSATAINASLPIVGTTASFTTLTATSIISTAVGFDTTGDGTAAAPAYTFASDPNTGLYSVGANDIGVTTNGILAMDISASAVTLALPLTSNGDVTFGVANTTASIAPATQATGTNGNAVTLTGGQAGAAATGAAGKNGGAVTITGGLGTDKEGAGTPSGDGGDVVLVGGAKGGTTSNVTGIVKVGSPSVQSTKAVDVLAVGGVLEVDGATLLDGNLSVTAGTITGPAEGSVVYNLMVDATATEIKNGHVLVTVPAARVFRLVDVKAVAYGNTCTTSTAMTLTATSPLVVYTTANLVRNTLLDMTSTGVAVPVDGAAFAAQAAGADLSILDETADTAGCTGVRFVITYALD